MQAKNLKEKESRVRIAELDALRGIAAISVVFFHFTMFRPQNNLFKFGVTGVDLFFIISGFVIFLTLKNTTTLRQFVISRVCRIYPTYWVAVSFTFIVMGLHQLSNGGNLNGLPYKQYIANLTMFQQYLKNGDLDGPYWTMLIEMLFYIFMALLFKLNLLVHIDKICIALTLLIIFYFKLLTPLPAGLQVLGRYFPIAFHFPLFYSGIIFYSIYSKSTKSLFFSYFLLFVCFLVQVHLFNFGGRSRFVLSQTQYSILLASYFILFSLFSHRKLQFLVFKPFLFLGAISFPLYLIHQFISLKILLPWLTSRVGFTLAFVISLITVIVIASVIAFFIEPIAKNTLRALLNKLFLLSNPLLDKKSKKNAVTT